MSCPVCVCVYVNVCVRETERGVRVRELYYSGDESPGCEADTSAAPSIDQAFK